MATPDVSVGRSVINFILASALFAFGCGLGAVGFMSVCIALWRGYYEAKSYIEYWKDRKYWTKRDGI